MYVSRKYFTITVVTPGNITIIIIAPGSIVSVIIIISSGSIVTIITITAHRWHHHVKVKANATFGEVSTPVVCMHTYTQTRTSRYIP